MSIIGEDMSDSFAGGVATTLLVAAGIGIMWGFMHCHSFGFFTACF